MTTSIIDAIISLKKGVGVTVEDNSFNKIKWDDEADKISKKDIQAEMDRMDAEYDAQEYARKREAEYPTIQECVHAILDDDLTALQEKRQAIKTKYPKS